VALKVANFDEVVAFYTDVLGLEPRISWGEGDKRAVMLDVGAGSFLEVFAGGDSAEPAGPVLHFALACQDIDAMIEKVRAAGRDVTVEPKDVDIPSDPVYPVRIAFFQGPGGEVVELFKVR
jgi:glyoxylase I family protein